MGVLVAITTWFLTGAFGLMLHDFAERKRSKASIKSTGDERLSPKLWLLLSFMGPLAFYLFWIGNVIAVDEH